MQPQHLQFMSDSEFLAYLRSRDIQVRMEGGKLKISAPAGSMDDSLKAELVLRKATLLAHFAQPALKILQQESASKYPLSYAQERLWLLERFHPGNFAYNIPEASDVHAHIDPALMQQAIDHIVGRQDSLRTYFQEDERGVVSQYVLPRVNVPLRFIDFSQLEAAVRDVQLQRVIRELSRQAFDLQSAPLVRFYVFKMETERFIVFINIHHIISDRWSMRILYGELLSAYRAFSEGKQPGLAPLSLQYSEYARCERQSDTTVIEQQLRYWQKQLADPPEPLHLPWMLKPATQRPFEGALFAIELSEQDTKDIRALARINQASPYMVLLAGYITLLSRLTGSGDQCVGSPVSDRARSDTSSVIGLFVNTLVIRARVERRSTFTQFLKTVRETVLEAQANRDVPLQRILAELHPEHGATTPQLFQTMFAFDPFISSFNAPSVSAIELDPGLAKFELTLQLNEERDCIRGWFEYRTDLFTAAAIAKFAESFRLLLRSSLRSPDKEVASLELVSGGDRELLQKWNATDRLFPRDTMIHRLFEDQAAETPSAIAIVNGHERVPYAELNCLANRIAAGILERRLPVESIVGVHMHRSPMMIAAMLGILKAGAAYLPLDPTYPDDRLRFTVKDSGCTLILSEFWQERAHPGEYHIVSPASLAASQTGLPPNPTTAATPHNLAYVIYTSGSTGRPKGVAIEHRNTVAFLEWGRNEFPSDVLRGTLASTSISFDLSVFEIFLPLATGNTVILAKDILELSSLPAAADVTLATTVPSAIGAMLDAKAIPDTLRTINLAGEPLSSALVERIYKETSITAVNDLYGPTETTTYSTWARRIRGMQPTIGRPITNTRLYIVDDALELLPVGVPGELLIAGDGVARGYIGRPELTAEKFVSLAHLGEPGRAYRTGDRCSWNPDGMLAYEGRIDQQVKIRGHRIELEEVESALASFPGVLQAIATTAADGKGNNTILAAVRQQQGTNIDVPAMVAHQSSILPPFMVARHLFVVQDFPRTANGKIDRRRLAELYTSREAVRTIEEPSDPLEIELVRIWQEAFGSGSLGIDDDFFELGGHSLMALRIFSEIESQLGHRLMLSVLFQAPTVRALANHIRQEKPA